MEYIYRAIKEMLGEKTVVLVTHQLQYLREADVILAMREVNRLIYIIVHHL